MEETSNNGKNLANEIAEQINSFPEDNVIGGINIAKMTYDGVKRTVEEQKLNDNSTTKMQKENVNPVDLRKEIQTAVTHGDRAETNTIQENREPDSDFPYDR